MSLSLDNINGSMNGSLETSNLSMGAFNTSLDLNISPDKQFSNLVNAMNRSDESCEVIASAIFMDKPLKTDAIKGETSSIENSHSQYDISALLNSSEHSSESKKSKKSKSQAINTSNKTNIKTNNKSDSNRNSKSNSIIENKIEKANKMDNKKHQDKNFESKNKRNKSSDTIETEDETQILDTDDISEIIPSANQSKDSTFIEKEYRDDDIAKLEALQDSFRNSKLIRMEKSNSDINDSFNFKSDLPTMKTKLNHSNIQKNIDKIENYSSNTKKRKSISSEKSQKSQKIDYKSDSDSENSENSTKGTSLSATFKNIVENGLYFAPRQTRNQKKHEKLLLKETVDENRSNSTDHESSFEKNTTSKRKHEQIATNQSINTSESEDTESEDKTTPRKRRKILVPEEKVFPSINQVIKKKSSKDKKLSKNEKQSENKREFKQPKNIETPVSQSRLFRQIQENPWAIQALPRRRTHI